MESGRVLHVDATTHFLVESKMLAFSSGRAFHVRGTATEKVFTRATLC